MPLKWDYSAPLNEFVSKNSERAVTITQQQTSSVPTDNDQKTVAAQARFVSVFLIRDCARCLVGELTVMETLCCEKR